MISPVILFFVAAALLLGVAGLLFFGSRKIDLDQTVRKRFQTMTNVTILTEKTTGRHDVLSEWWSRKLMRAGLEVSRKNTLLMLGAVMAACFIGVVGWGGKGLSLPIMTSVAIHLFLEQRSGLRSAAMLAQLPGFIDHIIRGLGTGRTMENTFLQATQQCRSPLREILDRVRVNVEVGAHLSNELQQVAKVHRLREMQLLSLAVSVNQRFGGSARELLQSIVTMIQQREQAQRELRALTGETRVSAWVLGLLPIGVAAYIMVVNPGYLDVMWQDSSGRKVLLTALGMQCFGAALLWRMVRSI